MAIPTPDAAVAIAAIADGNANTLAIYLTLHSPPDPEVIREIVIALTETKTKSGFRLQFVRRTQGQPSLDPFTQAWDDNEIFQQVIAREQELRAKPGPKHGHMKRAQGDVAKVRGATPRSIRAAYERVKRRRA
jgi:hypothetical protein